MTTLFYDGSFEGLLTAVFEIYAHKLGAVKLKLNGPYNTALFGDVMMVVTDEDRAGRVLRGMKAKLTAGSLQRLYAAYLAEIMEDDNPIIGYIRYVFDSDGPIEGNYANNYVRRISEIVKMVRREKHRMEAFIRFQKLTDGIFYATVEPDFNVLPLVLRHFKDRYADQKWMIYDTRRAYGMYHDLLGVEYVTLEIDDAGGTGIASKYDVDEELYQVLWKDYFRSVNIEARKNTKLHLRHVPKRYWKNLTEKL